MKRLKTKHRLSLPAGPPAVDRGCMDRELLGTEVVFMT